MLKVLTGEIKLSALDLDRDFAGVDRLLEAEEWPFSRSDLEISHSQPKSTSYVARKGERLVGFFTTHNFGDIGYLDMMIVEPEYRKYGVAKALYLKTMLEMKRKGIHKYVVHTTNDSAPMIRFLRFRSSCDFTLVGREPGRLEGPFSDSIVSLGIDDFEQLVEMDSRSFGMSRPEWVRALLEQDEVKFFGLREGDELLASLCLRPRKAGALCIDGVNGAELADIERLTRAVLGLHSDRRIECFVKTDSGFHQLLASHDFVVPDFFLEIGPLVEWQKGDITDLGGGAHCLTWL